MVLCNVVFAFTLGMFGLLSCLLPLFYLDVECPTCSNGTDRTVCLVTTSMFNAEYRNTANRGDNRTALFAAPAQWQPADLETYDACGCLTTHEHYINQIDSGYVPQCTRDVDTVAGPMMATYASVMWLIALLAFIRLTLNAEKRRQCAPCYKASAGLCFLIASFILLLGFVLYFTVDTNTYGALYDLGPCAEITETDDDAQCLPYQGDDYEWEWIAEARGSAAFFPVQYRPGEAMLLTTLITHFSLLGLTLFFGCIFKCRKYRHRNRIPHQTVNEHPEPAEGRANTHQQHQRGLSEELYTLSSLYDKGHLTQSEFSQAKSQLLGQPVNNNQFSTGSTSLLNSSYPAVPSYTEAFEGRV